MDKNIKQMSILVYDSGNNPTENNLKNKLKKLICPTCGENCRIKIKDYKIKLFGCKNNHEINNILLEEFNFTQNLNEFKIRCNNCNNYFFKCINCNQNLCYFCKLIHNKEHKIINYEKKDYICNIHNESLISYCNECKTNICKSCDIKHNNHNIINFQEIALKMNKENKIKEQIEDFRKIIDKLSIKINGITKIFNKVLENLEIYYKINYDIFKNYEANNKNYYILQNITKYK